MKSKICCLKNVTRQCLYRVSANFPAAHTVGPRFAPLVVYGWFEGVCYCSSSVGMPTVLRRLPLSDLGCPDDGTKAAATIGSLVEWWRYYGGRYNRASGDLSTDLLWPPPSGLGWHADGLKRLPRVDLGIASGQISGGPPVGAKRPASVANGGPPMDGQRFAIWGVIIHSPWLTDKQLRSHFNHPPPNIRKTTV